MTTWTIPVHENAIEQSSNYEEQYHKLKSERDETAHRLNELENANRILRTKCAQLETFKKKVAGGEVDKGQLAASAGSVSRQEKSSYDDLFRAYEIINRQHRSTIAKNKSYLQHIGKLKKEIQTLKLRCGAPRLKHYSASNSVLSKQGEKIELPVAMADSKENVECAASVNIVLEQLQSRLNDAEAQLSALRSKPLVAESKTSNEETMTKLHLLESQHELDEARILAQTEKLEKILDLHKEYKERYGLLKKQLDKYHDKNEALEIQVAELEERKKQATELKEHNCFLEQKMIQMCKVAEHEEDNKRVRILSQQMEDKHKECELLIHENRNLRERTAQLDTENQQRLDNAEHILAQKEESLQQQVTTNRSLRKQLQEATDGLNREILLHERTVEELSSKAVRRLQRIRLLESQKMIEDTGHEIMRLEQDNAAFKLDGRNSVEITIHGASLTGVSGETKTFILVDFHYFKSEVSDIASGANPTYDLAINYEMTESDDAAFLLLAESFVRVELYVLVREETPPKLLAWASFQTSALLTPLAQARSPALELLQPDHEGGGEAVGSLNLSVHLARSISMIHAPSRMMDLVAEGDIASRVQRAMPDAITISIASVSLPRGRVLYGNDDLFYVQYRFITREVTTRLECADARGMISFRHKSSFPIISTEDGSFEPVFWALSRVAVYFTLFAGGRRENDLGEWEKGEYRIVGQARVSLGEAWSRTNATTTEIISPEAKIVGSMSVSIETNAKPTLRNGGDDDSSKRRSAAHSRFMALLTEVTSYIGTRGDEDETVDVARLLRFIDPPSGIDATAENLRRLLGARRFRCHSPDGCVISSPNLWTSRPDDYGDGDDGDGFGDGMTSASEFARRTEDARHRGSLPMKFPPDEEMEDIYRHISTNDGQLSISDMNYFVASNSVVTLRTTIRKLRRITGRDVRADLRGMTDGEQEAVATTIRRRELHAYSTEIFNCLSDAELIHLSSSLMSDLSR